MTFGSLFSGIGGLDLGLERAGMECRWQCEIEPYCRQVLAKHWPNIPCYEDVRTIGENLEPVDLICGGYPCQPFSYAGKREGGRDERHLWPDFYRIIRILRPRYVLLENVPGHLSLGFGEVLGDLAALGFDAEWDCLPASAFGAYHERDRLFVLAYATEMHGISRRVLEAGRDGRTLLQSRRLHSLAVATRAERENTRLEREPELGRLVSRVPHRTHRLEGVGNAVYPDVAEWLGRRIMQAASEQRRAA